MNRFGYLAVAASLVVAGCADEAVAPLAPTADASVLDGAVVGGGPLDRYVAMGTSISMGWASDGVLAASQYGSWPAQLSRLTGRELSQPYISGTGCRAPMAAPLASGLRISGEPVLADPATVACAPLMPGIDLPTRNVSVSAATTFDALNITPETRNDPFYSRLYPLLYPANTTQLRAALRHRPRIISVEFGANEILGARDGRAIPGVTLFPFPQWAVLYGALLDTVATNVTRGVLVGLIDDVASFPAFRTGHELWNDRQSFLRAFHIEVKRDCRNSPNLIVVPFRVPAAVAAGLGARARGLPPIEFTCTAGPATVPDFVLDPSEAAIINAQLKQMNTVIKLSAEKIGYAHFRLEALYGLSALKPPFSVVALMTSPTPYSALMSLDGFHPSAQGQAVLANAAARALNRTYRLGIPVTTAIASE